MANLEKAFEKIMSEDSLKKAFVEANKNKTLEEFFKSIGFEATTEEIIEFVKNNEGKMDESELENITGGCKSDFCSIAFSAGNCCFPDMPTEACE